MREWTKMSRQEYTAIKDYTKEFTKESQVSIGKKFNRSSATVSVIKRSKNFTDYRRIRNWYLNKKVAPTPQPIKKTSDLRRVADALERIATALEIQQAPVYYPEPNPAWEPSTFDDQSIEDGLSLKKKKTLFPW